MKNDIFLFFILLLIFVILIFLGNLDLNLNNLFLGTVLSNKIWLTIIIGLSIFIYGKKIIDGFDEYK
ncbi:MAG: hypothetical protein Q8K30_01180 [Candidatus Gracilibacteria bacterium]|nr:hypothetical protein [Candidatus Gracilibacteria bacterium]